LIEDIEDIRSVDVDWDRERVDVTTRGRGNVDWNEKLSRKTVTTGCGQGTVFSCTLDKLYDARLPCAQIRQTVIYRLLRSVAAYNELYRKAGAVHGCALCRGEEVLNFVEDVGRHNAADAISGRMWLERTGGEDKIFYTTGRLTSEIVMKTAHMGIPVLLSRSGVTQMGMELAEDLGLTMIARAKGHHFLVYTGKRNVVFDGIPERRSPASTPTRNSSVKTPVKTGE
jgi:FdhD protein